MSGFEYMDVDQIEDFYRAVADNTELELGNFRPFTNAGTLDSSLRWIGKSHKPNKSVLINGDHGIHIPNYGSLRFHEGIVGIEGSGEDKIITYKNRTTDLTFPFAITSYELLSASGTKRTSIDELTSGLSFHDEGRESAQLELGVGVKLYEVETKL